MSNGWTLLALCEGEVWKERRYSCSTVPFWVCNSERHVLSAGDGGAGSMGLCGGGGAYLTHLETPIILIPLNLVDETGSSL